MRLAAFGVGVVYSLVCIGAAEPGERGPSPEPPPEWLVFGGVSAGVDYGSLYGGLIHAPVGSLWEPGLRIRFSSAAGFYRTGAETARRTVPFASSSVLAGYQLSAEGHSLSIYSGVEAVFFARADPPHYRAGWHTGLKALAEAHLELDDRTSADAHVGYGTASDGLEAGGKVLRRFSGLWRLGPEAAFFDKPDGRDLRFGLAMSQRHERSGLNGSVGLSFSEDKDAAPYLTIGFDSSF